MVAKKKWSIPNIVSSYCDGIHIADFQMDDSLRTKSYTIRRLFIVTADLY